MAELSFWRSTIVCKEPVLFWGYYFHCKVLIAPKTSRTYFNASGSNRSLVLRELSPCWWYRGKMIWKWIWSFPTQGILCCGGHKCQQQDISPKPRGDFLNYHVKMFSINHHLSMESPSTGQWILNLVQGAFLALNQTQPNLTNPCWLCLTSGPPYYEGIATIGKYISTTSANGCDWKAAHKLTLTQISGQGICLGSPPSTHQPLCNQTNSSLGSSTYLIPEPGHWWACNTGLTPCIYTQNLNTTKDFCILIRFLPRVFYHPANYLEQAYETPEGYPVRIKREPISFTLAILLGAGMAAGVGTGTVALVQGSCNYNELKTAMDEDIKAIEGSITKVEKSLASLAEVALQNRRGLDLLFLKEGGLCAALKEECCFYVNHSGVIRDSMAKHRERLNQRRRERESQQGWFEGWFNSSTWLTTLISTLLEPLFILLLLLTFGTCILNHLLWLIRELLSITQALVLTQQYQALKQQEGP